jgi:hypothetical protein
MLLQSITSCLGHLVINFLVAKDKISFSDENKAEIIEGIHLLNLFGENKPEGVQKQS